MLGQVVGAHEPLVADRAGEPLLSGVRAQMALELVGARETLPAEEPVADKGPLAGVPTKMGLQVGRLSVDLATARDVAVVNVFFAQRGGSRPKTFQLLAVGTVAGGAASVPSLGARGAHRRLCQAKRTATVAAAAAAAGCGRLADRQHGLVGFRQHMAPAQQSGRARTSQP